MQPILGRSVERPLILLTHRQALWNFDYSLAEYSADQLPVPAGPLRDL